MKLHSKRWLDEEINKSSFSKEFLKLNFWFASFNILINTRKAIIYSIYNINYALKCLEIQNKLYPFESTQILTVPARTVTTFYIPIKNTDKSEGYVPRLHIGKGIYAGDAIVKKFNGKAYIKFANTNEISVTISIPAITLEDFEERDFQNITSQSSNLKNLRGVFTLSSRKYVLFSEFFFG